MLYGFAKMVVTTLIRATVQWLLKCVLLRDSSSAETYNIALQHVVDTNNPPRSVVSIKLASTFAT